MLRLHPPAQPLPDNIWHTLLITGLASLFLWLGWENLVESFRAGGPASVVEARLLEGEGHPLYVWVEADPTDPATPLIWNRTLSSVGWLFSLILLCRMLTRRSGFISSLPSLILLATFPGLTPYMAAGGSGAFGLFFFLMAYSAVVLEDSERAWIRAGVYAALAVFLNPLWFLPSLGLLAGTFEAQRPRLTRLAIGYGAGLLLVLAASVFLPDGGSLWIPGAAGDGGAPGSWASPPLQRHVFLAGALLLMLAYGASRRGAGWWWLTLSLPALLFHSPLAADLSAALVPTLAGFALGLVKLPTLIDLRHPRGYQSVLLCQLLLWLPVYLDHQPALAFPSHDAAETEEPAPAAFPDP